MSAARINQANGRLKAARVGLKIEQIGDRLYLRGTLPPKPNSGKTKPYQQRIALGVLANPAGISFAEREAHRIGVLLATKQFNWAEFERGKAETIADWIGRFQEDYFATRERNDKTETTWEGDYLKVLRKLPPEAPLSSELLLEAILATPPDTKTRKRTCMVLGALAKFANLDLDVSRYSGSYSPKSTAPRDIPDDCLIAQCYYQLENPAWRWVYGMLATYGLRPHEVFRLNFEKLGRGDMVLDVLENTKTGFRRVWPCYPEWFEEFRLSQVQLPPINTKRPNLAVGRACSQYLSAKLPFRPYDLRHAWAVRTLAFGLDLSLAAQQMGHSVQVHCATYHRWITERHHQAAFEALMLRADRPRAPKAQCNN